MNRSLCYYVLALSGLVLAFTQNQAQAQPKPFKVTGKGVAPQGIPFPGQDPRPHTAAGNATHLGRYHGGGAVQTDSLDPQTGTGEFGSAVPFVFVAANGDRLACHYGRTDFGAKQPGVFQIVPVEGGKVVAHFIAEFVPVPGACTGRFEGVGGSWIMFATTEPFTPGSTDPVGYTWEGRGTLVFPQGN